MRDDYNSAATHLLKLLVDDNPEMTYPRDIYLDLHDINRMGCIGDEYIIVTNPCGTHSGFKRIKLSMESPAYSLESYKDTKIYMFKISEVTGSHAGGRREAWGRLTEISHDEFIELNNLNLTKETAHERMERIRLDHKFILCGECGGSGDPDWSGYIRCDQCRSLRSTY